MAEILGLEIELKPYVNEQDYDAISEQVPQVEQERIAALIQSEGLFEGYIAQQSGLYDNSRSFLQLFREPAFRREFLSSIKFRQSFKFHLPEAHAYAIGNVDWGQNDARQKFENKLNMMRDFFATPSLLSRYVEKLRKNKALMAKIKNPELGFDQLNIIHRFVFSRNGEEKRARGECVEILEKCPDFRKYILSVRDGEQQEVAGKIEILGEILSYQEVAVLFRKSSNLRKWAMREETTEEQVKILRVFLLSDNFVYDHHPLKQDRFKFLNENQRFRNGLLSCPPDKFQCILEGLKSHSDTHRRVLFATKKKYRQFMFSETTSAEKIKAVFKAMDAFGADHHWIGNRAFTSWLIDKKTSTQDLQAFSELFNHSINFNTWIHNQRLPQNWIFEGGNVADRVATLKAIHNNQVVAAWFANDAQPPAKGTMQRRLYELLSSGKLTGATAEALVKAYVSPMVREILNNPTHEIYDLVAMAFGNNHFEAVQALVTFYNTPFVKEVLANSTHAIHAEFKSAFTHNGYDRARSVFLVQCVNNSVLYEILNDPKNSQHELLTDIIRMRGMSNEYYTAVVEWLQDANIQALLSHENPEVSKAVKDWLLKEGEYAEKDKIRRALQDVRVFEAFSQANNKIALHDIGQAENLDDLTASLENNKVGIPKSLSPKEEAGKGEIGQVRRQALISRAFREVFRTNNERTTWLIENKSSDKITAIAKFTENQHGYDLFSNPRVRSYLSKDSVSANDIDNILRALTENKPYTPLVGMMRSAVTSKLGEIQGTTLDMILKNAFGITIDDETLVQEQKDEWLWDYLGTGLVEASEHGLSDMKLGVLLFGKLDSKQLPKELDISLIQEKIERSELPIDQLLQMEDHHFAALANPAIIGLIKRNFLSFEQFLPQNHAQRDERHQFLMTLTGAGGWLPPLLEPTKEESATEEALETDLLDKIRAIYDKGNVALFKFLRDYNGGTEKLKTFLELSAYIPENALPEQECEIAILEVLSGLNDEQLLRLETITGDKPSPETALEALKRNSGEAAAEKLQETEEGKKLYTSLKVTPSGLVIGAMKAFELLENATVDGNATILEKMESANQDVRSMCEGISQLKASDYRELSALIEIQGSTSGIEAGGKKEHRASTSRKSLDLVSFVAGL